MQQTVEHSGGVPKELLHELHASHSSARRNTIIILGCGVIGLTAAIQLAHYLHKHNLQEKYAIRIWTREIHDITSYKAGAIWQPYGAEGGLVNQLATETWHHFDRDMQDSKENGVRMMEGYTMNIPETPSWVSDVHEWRSVGHRKWKSRRFLIDMDKYMPYLLRQCRELGIKVETVHSVNHHTDLERECEQYMNESNTHIPFVVNATGLDSRTLFEDEDVLPVCGYTLLMKTSTGNELMNKNFFIRDEEGPGMMYVLPRTDSIVVCGGTAYYNCWDTSKSEREAEIILNRIDTHCPELQIRKVATIHKHSIGLRPYRKSGIRIETDRNTLRNIPVVHSYGMGGSGATICWGAANQVVKLADEIIRNDHRHPVRSRM